MFWRSVILSVVVLSAPAYAGKFNKVLSTGDAAPNWSGLTGVDDKEHGLAEWSEAKVLVLMVMCNHCPCVRAYEDRMVAMQKEWTGQGVQLVAVNPNSGTYEELSDMKERAKLKSFNFPYLHDPEQKVATAYGARQTPTAFVFDASRKLVYQGAIDDHRDPAAVTEHYVRDAVEATLAGKKSPHTETRPVGCLIDGAE